jgi:leucyl aminopeptidase
MKIKFAALKVPASGTVVVFAAKDAGLTGLAAEIDAGSDGHLTKAIKSAEFDGKRDSFLEVVAPCDTGLKRVIIAGIGDPAELDQQGTELLGGAIAGRLLGLKEKAAALAVDELKGCKLAVSEMAALIGSGLRLRTYAFTKFKTKKENGEPSLKEATVLTSAVAAARKAYAPYEAVAAGVHMARDLVNEPANTLHPVEFARRAKALSKLGLEVEVLDDKQMTKLGMGSLLGVAMGSHHPARMAIMRWNGAGKTKKPLAFIGKGVTFDTGGTSLKPGAGMEAMKGDMGGAACVTGLMAALAMRKAKVNAIGVIGLVENMPDGKAQRPGDVVTSMSGQTIAVHNTDAEGRLVLADALWYTQDRFKPQFMINLATLTGAIMVALGKEYAGLFSNNDELSERLHAIGNATGERVWRMPLDEAYNKLLDDDTADMKNIGGRFAGAITAAQFLQRFVNDVPWAHLDVAGTAMDAKKTAINPSWASGWGVRLLNALIATHYE